MNVKRIETIRGIRF